MFPYNKNSPRGGTDYILKTASYGMNSLESDAKDYASGGADLLCETSRGVNDEDACEEGGALSGKDYTTSFSVDQPPEQVFNAINNPRQWWSDEIKGTTDKVGGVFDYHYEDVHRCRIKVAGLTPGKRVEWLVLENHFSFTKDKSEWKGTRMIFEISKRGNKTEVRFTHLGLVPQYECYDICTDSWGSYIRGSLKSLITTGTGHPN